jgi:heavy metal translocating P-type ATPase
MNIMMISLLLYAGSVEPANLPIFRLILFGLSTPALAILLPPFLSGARNEFSSRAPSVDVLIACGSVSAFAVSAVNTLRGSGPVFFDTCTMLPVLVTLGRVIESCAKSRAGDLLHGLETLLPATALRLGPDGEAEVPHAALEPGDLIRVRPGERIAVDGLVLDGTSCIEEAAFTGEFLPRNCTGGDRVLAGTVNGSGPLLVRAERTGSDLLLQRIVQLVHQAWRAPSPAERISDRAAKRFIPVTMLIALASLLAWTLAGEPARGLFCALSVLVVACPCTMGIATPLATSLAVVRAARSGILVRGGAVIERLAGIDLVFFDKTGTLTRGEPQLISLELFEATEREELLGRLVPLMSASGHLLGQAVVAEAAREGIAAGSASRLHLFPGRGVSGAVSWRGSTQEVSAGGERFSQEGSRSAAADYGTVAGEGSVIEVAWEGKLRGRLQFHDPVRPDAAWCVDALGLAGVATVLLSGDRLPAARSAARAAGIERVEAPRTPEGKFLIVRSAVESGSTVAMVGDGINDAAALAAAGVGIAFGCCTDLARHSGNVVVLSQRLTQIPWLIGLGRKTARIIYGNFAWSFCYNFVALAAAAFGLLHPLLAALAMVASSFTVLANSLRISGFPDSPADSGSARAGAAVEAAVSHPPPVDSTAQSVA